MLLGLPPVDLHGPLHRLAIMDLLCGGTWAACYIVLGHWGAAWRYDPVGLVSVVLVALLVARGPWLLGAS